MDLFLTEYQDSLLRHIFTAWVILVSDGAIAASSVSGGDV